MKHVLVLALVLTAVGCRPDDQETGSVTPEDVREARDMLPEDVLAHLDSGNARYQDHDYQAALEHYRAVVDGAPDAPAGWFGIYMAQLALGNTAAADSAMARARELAPGASLIRPTPPDTTT
jgi:tetratricopeptide (TPR) repeat protein